MAASNAVEKSGRGWLWKVPLGILLVLLVGMVILALSIDSIALGQINKALNRFLVNGGTLEKIDIQLVEGRVALTGLRINSPEGYGAESPLHIDSAVLDIQPATIMGNEIVIEQLTLKGAALVAVRDKQGRLNLTKLLKPVEK